MTNQSIVVLESDNQEKHHHGVYLAWNGGMGKVAAFLDETKRRIGSDALPLKFTDNSVKNNEIMQLFYKTFSEVANLYYDSITPNHSGQVSIHNFVRNRYPRRCGYYSVDDNLDSPHIDGLILSDSELTDYERISKFFSDTQAAL